jgi:lipoprotein signal peptidase
MARPSYRWLFASLAAFGLVADQASKYGVFRWLHNGRYAVPSSPDTYSRSVVPGWFEFTVQYDPQAAPCGGRLARLQTWSAPELPRVNHGALCGLGGSGKSATNGVFAALGVGIIAIIIWVARHDQGRDKWFSAALGLVLGGVLGNLCDRVVFGGIRDFLNLHRFGWPVFNVADCCLVLGACLLAARSAVEPTDEPGRPSSGESA